MPCVMRLSARVALTAAGFLAVTSIGIAKAGLPIARLHAITSVAGFRGTAAWSAYDPQHHNYRLV